MQGLPRHCRGGRRLRPCRKCYGSAPRNETPQLLVVPTGGGGQKDERSVVGHRDRADVIGRRRIEASPCRTDRMRWSEDEIGPARSSARGVGCIPVGDRTNHSSSNTSRSRVSAPLMGDWLRRMRCPARVTWRSAYRASNAFNKFRSRPATSIGQQNEASRESDQGVLSTPPLLREWPTGSEGPPLLLRLQRYERTAEVGQQRIAREHLQMVQ